MNISSVIRISFAEIKSNIKMFAISAVIISILFSISASILSLAMTIPSVVSSEIGKSDSDIVFANNLNETQISEMLKFPASFVNCEPTPYLFTEITLDFSEKGDKSFYGGVLLNSFENTTMFNKISDNLVAGKLEFGQINNACPIWISEPMADAYGIYVGDKLTLKGSENEFVCNLFVAGIYSKLNDTSEYYISEAAYHKFLSMHANLRLNLEMRATNYKILSKIIKWANANNVIVFYNKDIVFAVQMFYYTFFVINLTLLLAVTFILRDLLNIYLSKRLKFYALNRALGMSDKDVSCVLFCVIEGLIILSTAVSCGVFASIVSNIGGYVKHTFSLSDMDVSAKFQPILIDFVLLQMMSFAMMVVFNLRRNKDDIISVMRGI